MKVPLVNSVFGFYKKDESNLLIGVKPHTENTAWP